jgi:Ca2+-transporting ATPase
VVITLVVFAVFMYCLFLLDYNPSVANTVVFFSLSLAQLLHPLSLVPRSASIFNNQITRNIHVWLAVIFCMVLIMVVYLIPASNQVLSLASLSSNDWLLVLCSGVLPVAIIRALKFMKVVE